jgi:hypothetical protein
MIHSIDLEEDVIAESKNQFKKKKRVSFSFSLV